MFELSEIIKAIGAKLIRKSNCNLIEGVSTDSRTIKDKDIFFALEGKNFDGHDFIDEVIKKGARAIVISKDAKDVKQKINPALRAKVERVTEGRVNILRVKDTTIAFGQLAKYYRKKFNLPLIAITGSTGKTTTKDIIFDILNKDYNVLKNLGTYNNSIGVPQTIFKLNKKHDISILELGTNHFGEISYLGKITTPEIAIITNIGASHLEFLKDLDGVFKEKKNILLHLRSPKIVLLNGNDEYLKKIKLTKDFRVFHFGINKPFDFCASNIFIENNRVNFTFNKKHRFSLNSLGRFNIYNALAGIGCGLIFGISMKKMKQTLDNFKFPQGRLNKIDCPRFSILDDTYNSNPLSLKNAIESLSDFKSEGRKILVMGDMLELGSHSIDLHRQIGSFIIKKPIDILVTLGNLSRTTADTAQSESRNNLSVFSFFSKMELIDFLKSKIRDGDVLLIKGSRLIQMEDIVSSLTQIK